MPGRSRSQTLGTELKRGRTERGLSLRAVERDTGIKSGHLSQIETGTIARPDMTILWELAGLYGLDFERLLALAGLAVEGESQGRSRQRMTVALRALQDLGPEEQADVLAYIAAVRARRDAG